MIRDLVLKSQVANQPRLAAGDLTIAVVLSVLAVTSALGLTSSHNHGGIEAAVAVLLMTAPILIARRDPILAAAALAVGAAVNWGLVGHLVRCGAALPAVFYVAFCVGSRTSLTGPAVLGFALLGANLVCQAYSDPQLGGPSVLVLMVPITLAFLGAGELLQRRNRSIETLRQRTNDLQDLREETARMAVAADQARIVGHLDGYLQGQVDEIAATASAGRTTLAAEPDASRQAFLAIQETGRRTLNHMRGVVTNLREQAPTGPQPVLAQLDRLLADSTRSEARLGVVGDLRLLPPGVELSGYRIVEHLLATLVDDPAARIDVEVAFSTDALTLTVNGPTVRNLDARAALAAATERAALLGGTVSSAINSGSRATVVRIPLAGGYV